MSALFEIEDGRLTSCQTDDTGITIPEGVRSIGENVFKGMRRIERITLPDSLIIIEAGAFKGCMSLGEINFPNALTEIGEYAFHRCHSLKSVILPDSVKKLGRCAFLYCDGMETVSVCGVGRLERQTFANCTGLREIRLNSLLETDNLGDDIFTGCVNIKRIGFSDGQDLEFEDLAAIIGTDADPIAQAVARSVYRSMKLENGVLYKLAVNLKRFAIPEGVTRIEKSCFCDKKGITQIVLPKSLREIGPNAFGNCINLEEMIFQSDNIAIDNGAFKGCNNLERVVICGEVFFPKNQLSDGNLPVLVRRIGEQILSDFYISGEILMAYRGKEERVCVPDSVRVIGEGCFENNSAIGRVVLPASVREIRENAFKGCVSMQTIELSTSLEVIEKGAFENCAKLIRITLPQGVKRLGESAFKRCFKLAGFEANEALTEVGDMAFYGCKSLKSITLPPGTVINGRLVFFNSGISCAPETAEVFGGGYSGDGISQYEHCGDVEIVSVCITGRDFIGEYAFSGCPSLREVIIDAPDCVLGDHAFEKCAGLKRVKLNVKSIGRGAFSFCRSLEAVEINGAGAVGEQAFFGCGELREVGLSKSVTELKDRCFEECVSLKRFDFGGIKVIGERAFSRCEGLEEIMLPALLVRRRAFEDCCFLKSVSLLSDTELKSGAFFGCTELTTMILDGAAYHAEEFSQSVNSLSNPLPDRIREITASVFSCFDVGEDHTLKKYTGSAVHVRIPRDIAALGDEAFRNCVRTVSIDIPECVTYIGKLTFAGSGWLERMRSENKITIINDMIVDAFNCGSSAEIPAGIKRVCSWSFAGNTELSEVRFLGGRTIVDEYAFRNCVGVKRVIDESGRVYELTGIASKDDPTLPEFVRRIFAECVNCFKVDGDGTLFESTGNIKELALVNGIKAIGERVYKDCNLLRCITLCAETETIGESAFENGKWLKSVKNAVGVKRIEASAFCGCQSLEDIELSDALEFIGKRAFEHCCRLREILIPEGVTEIRERTFFRCKSLRRIVLPSTLKAIGMEAFAFCEELEEVVFPSGLTVAEERAFAHCPKLALQDIPTGARIEDRNKDGEA